jgi:pimeloyl-ACP methyl ester carboxylesterase
MIRLRPPGRRTSERRDGATAAEEARIHRLKDGRRLAYAEYGDNDGDPAFYFHGTPGSRLEAALLHEEARRRRFRLIGVDRPGFGLSDHDPARQFDHWPDDVAELADALGFERFAVIGLSGGGPHVIACAARIPHRLTGAAIMSGAGPIDAYIARSRTRFGRIARRAVLPFTRLWIHPMVWFMRWSLPRTSASRMARFVDRRVLARPRIAEGFREDLIEALRPGSAGAIHEFKLHTRPWKVRLENVPMHIDLWHGDDDRIVRIDIGRYVASHLNDCEARILHNEGHLLIVDHQQELFVALRQARA